MEQILDANGNTLDFQWAAEFVGFFMADGNLHIARFHRNAPDRQGNFKYNYHFLRPVASISQRSDNRPLLEDICAKLGGNVSKRAEVAVIRGGFIRKPSIQWKISTKEGVQRVVDILRMGKLPYRDLQDKICIMQEFLDLTHDKGQHYDDATRARREELRLLLSETCKYKE